MLSELVNVQSQNNLALPDPLLDFQRNFLNNVSQGNSLQSPKPFVPQSAMTPRMRRILMALLIHQNTYKKISRLLRTNKYLSSVDEAFVINNLIRIAKSEAGDFLSDSPNEPINIDAIESPMGLAIKFALEYKDGGFKLELHSKLRPLNILWDLVIIPQERPKKIQEIQKRMEELSSVLSKSKR